MTNQQANIIAAAIREGFADLGNRIAGGPSSENVAIPLMELANNISSIASGLESVASAIAELETPGS